MKKEKFNEGWSLGPVATMMSAFMGVPPERQPVTLPHDAMLSQTRDPHAAGGRNKGYFPEGQYEYRKLFTPLPEQQGRRLILEFEGVYMNAEVFVNSDYAGGCPYGYRDFYIDLDRFLKYGEENTIRVKADTADDCRWYSGAGIYRNVNLITGGPARFALNGVKLLTEDIGEDYAVVTVENILESDHPGMVRGWVSTELIDPEGRAAAADKTPVSLFPGKTVVRQRILVQKPRLWDPESPSLYVCASKLLGEDKNAVLDTEKNSFGIRILKLDIKQGLRINGKTVKLRGACIHHDNGVLGAATFERAEERRAELLKQAGFNALRSAHHPMSRAMLDACDRTGLLVMDEAYDMWTTAKTGRDYSRYFSEWWERDITAMVEKDYNHPCVVLYSIGNEIPETGSSWGTQWGRKLAERIRQLDSSRFIINSINGMVSAMETLARMREAMGGGQGSGGDINAAMADIGAAMKQVMNSEIVGKATEESYACVDLSGYNYMDARYEEDGKLYPHRVICGSETFPRDIAANWALVEKLPYLIGDFTWTGWDYLGEAGIGKIAYEAGASNMAGEYPWISAWCGDLDITGFRRPISYYREIVWGLRKTPYIAVLKPEHYGKKAFPSPWAWSDSTASWTWPGYEGKPIAVEVYADAEEAALLLDGKELGRAPVVQYKAVFDTVYRPGKLEVLAYKDGKERSRWALQSCGPDLMLSLASDREELRLGRGDLAYLAISLRDAAGTINTAAEAKLSVTVEGAGVLQGLGSGSPVTTDVYTGNECGLFEGRALAVIRPTAPGEIRVRVQAAGHTARSLTLRVTAPPPPV
jgi:beta-galactosidase